MPRSSRCPWTPTFLIDSIAVLFESKEWLEVPENARVPEFEITFTALAQRPLGSYICPSTMYYPGESAEKSYQDDMKLDDSIKEALELMKKRDADKQEPPSSPIRFREFI